VSQLARPRQTEEDFTSPEVRSGPIDYALGCSDAGARVLPKMGQYVEADDLTKAKLHHPDGSLKILGMEEQYAIYLNSGRADPGL
jgi:hypothetical protein